MRVSLCVVTNRAAGDDSGGEVTPKLPRSSVVVGDPKEPANWRRGPKAGASYRIFGTVSPTRGRWKAFYVGPDRHRHTAGLTFSHQVRAQGWLANDSASLSEANGPRRPRGDGRSRWLPSHSTSWPETGSIGVWCVVGRSRTALASTTS